MQAVQSRRNKVTAVVTYPPALLAPLTWRERGRHCATHSIYCVLCLSPSPSLQNSSSGLEQPSSRPGQAGAAAGGEDGAAGVGGDAAGGRWKPMPAWHPWSSVCCVTLMQVLAAAMPFPPPASYLFTPARVPCSCPCTAPVLQGPLVVYNAHLEVFCGLLARIAQLADIFADARRMADAGYPRQAILGGWDEQPGGQVGRQAGRPPAPQRSEGHLLRPNSMAA